MPVLTCDARDREGRAGMGHAASRPAGPRTHGGTFCSPRPSARGRRPGSRTTGAHQGPGKEAGESEREATGGAPEALGAPAARRDDVRARPPSRAGRRGVLRVGRHAHLSGGAAYQAPPPARMYK
jgi:hypothetical protein